jgi:excisionase family DNA binding protein
MRNHPTVAIHFAIARSNASAVAGTTPAIDGEIKMNSQLAYSIAEACAAARAGRTAIYAAIRDGALIARKRGRKTLILSEDLRRWVEGHPVVKAKRTSK